MENSLYYMRNLMDSRFNTMKRERSRSYVTDEEG